MIGGKFAPITIMNKDDTDIDSMITTFNTAETETASEILGKHRQKKKPLITVEIFDLCDKRRELRKKKIERAPQSRSLTYESSVRNIPSTSKTSTMSS